MKKKYIQPALQTVSIDAEGVFAASLPKIDGGDGSEEVGGSDALSNRGGWSSDNWTDSED